MVIESQVGRGTLSLTVLRSQHLGCFPTMWVSRSSRRTSLQALCARLILVSAHPVLLVLLSPDSCRPLCTHPTRLLGCWLFFLAPLRYPSCPYVASLQVSSVTLFTESGSIDRLITHFYQQLGALTHIELSWDVCFVHISGQHVPQSHLPSISGPFLLLGRVTLTELTLLQNQKPGSSQAVSC